MPRNASGTYALPSGNPVSSGTLIDATWANNTLNDLANEMTDSLSRSGEGGMLAPFRLNDGVQATPGLAFSNEPSTGLYRAGTNEMWAVVGGTQVQQFTANGAATRFAVGAVTTPSLTFLGDLNTGLWSPAADTLAASVGGAEAFRVSSAGNFGVGTTNPLERIAAFAAAGATLGLRSTNYTYVIDTVDSTGAFRIRRNDGVTDTRLVIDGSGNVGIGTANPLAKLTVSNAGAQGFEFDPANGILQVYNRNTFAYGEFRPYGSLMRFFTGSSPAETMRLDSSGNLGIGTASPAARLQVKSSLAQAVNIEGTTARGSGNIYAAFLDPTGRKGYVGYASGADDTFFVTNEMNAEILFQTNGQNRMRIDANGNVQAGNQAALATTATNGFLYVPTCAGTPTGTPTAITGMAPIVVNTTNNKLYFYSGGAWRDAGP